MNKIKVNLDKRSSHSYDIFIGKNILDRIALLIAKSSQAANYTIISDGTVSSLYGETVMSALRKTGCPVDLIEFPPGETSKTMETALSIIEQLADRGVDRTSCLIALGGGVTGDMVGFIASIYMRSIPYIQVPTTLLAQVDSSIGGKTGIDLFKGKNLVGTFCQPQAVYIDLQFLATLPDVEFTNGVAEIIKYGVIDDPDLLSTIESELSFIRDRNIDNLAMIVAHSCKIKKSIVEIDERDMGVRRILNFGHTIGHALESASGYTISHGNAVSVGMIAAARVSEKLNHLPAAERQRIEDIIQKAGLLDRIPATLKTGDIVSRIKHDKKKAGNAVHFVLLKKIGVPFINGIVDEGIIRETIEELRQ
jgi:3-dehydroquinate synthase